MDEHLRLYRIASAAFLATCRTVIDWDAPGLGEWTVRDLVGHTNRSHTNIVGYLAAGPEEGAGSVAGPVEYFASFWGPSPTEPGPDVGSVAERGRLAGAALGEDPVGAVARDREEVLAVLDRADPAARMRTPAGTMTLAGYLPTRLFELTVHTADLARATGRSVPAELEPAWSFALHLAADLALGRGAGVVVTEALTGRGPLSAGFTVL